jgi:hypothetical protein
MHVHTIPTCQEPPGDSELGLGMTVVVTQGISTRLPEAVMGLHTIVSSP